MPTNAELNKTLAGFIEKTEARLDALEAVDERPETPQDSDEVPSDYRQIVNEVLNNRFGLEVEPVSHAPAFNLTIIVPEEYSNASPEQKSNDRRVKQISYAEGSTGVREYAELVYKNFDQETRTRIVTDR